MKRLSLLIWMILVSCSSQSNDQVLVFECSGVSNPTEYLPMYVDKIPTFEGGNFIQDSAAVYTEMGKRAGIEGTTLVSFDINEDGLSVNGRVHLGIGAGLDEASLQGAQSKLYIPALTDGSPVCSRIYAQFHFKLDDPQNVTMELVLPGETILD